MAIVRVEVLRGLAPEQRGARVDAVHRALVSALRVPADDPTVVLTELDLGAARLRAGDSADFTLVQVTLFAGGSDSVKRTLYRQLCRQLAEAGVAASEDLGFRVHI
jgi:hypothetical protein